MQSQQTQLSLSYYPWITQSISGDPLRQAIDRFRGLLEAELRQGMGHSVGLTLQPAMEVPVQLDDIKKKPADGVVCKIGLLNPIGYAIAHAAMPAVECVAVIQRKIGDGPVRPTYKAQLYSHVDSGIKSIEDIRGRSMAFGSAQSTSNFLVPAVMLWEQGIHPGCGFSRVEFTGGHDKAALAVYQRKLDVGAGHDGVIFDLAAKPDTSDAEQKLKRIAWSEEIPSDPVAVNSPDPEVRDQVQKALLRVAKPDDDNSAGNQAVKAFWGTTKGFAPIAADAYNSLRRMMYPIGLRPDDMLRK